MPSSLHSKKYEIFRQLLVEARFNAGLTQAVVAAKLGKPQSFVSKFERGERRLDLTEFIELADILGVDTAEFIASFRSRI